MYPLTCRCIRAVFVRCSRAEFIIFSRVYESNLIKLIGLQNIWFYTGLQETLVQNESTKELIQL